MQLLVEWERGFRNKSNSLVRKRTSSGFVSLEGTLVEYRMRTSGSTSCSFMCESMETNGLPGESAHLHRMKRLAAGRLLYTDASSNEDGAFDV